MCERLNLVNIRSRTLKSTITVTLHNICGLEAAERGWELRIEHKQWRWVPVSTFASQSIYCGFQASRNHISFLSRIKSLKARSLLGCAPTLCYSLCCQTSTKFSLLGDKGNELRIKTEKEVVDGEELNN